MIHLVIPGQSKGDSDPPGPPPKQMVWVPGGTFLMGSNDFYPEERPVRSVTVDGFRRDEHPVTNAEFRRFVKATGYVTVAECPPDPSNYPDVDPSLLCLQIAVRRIGGSHSRICALCIGSVPDLSPLLLLPSPSP